jgi:hypothetical protein
VRTLHLLLATFAITLGSFGADSDPRTIGFSLIAAPQKLLYHVGEEVTLSIVTVNERPEKLKVFESLDGLVFSVHRNGTETVELLPERQRFVRSLTGGFIREVPMRCGLRVDKTLNADFDLTRPGRYTVEVRLYSRSLPHDFDAKENTKAPKDAGVWVSTSTEFTVINPK